ncbi:hypothetical protein CWI38_0512p0060, partial [Hamiltosporidium tvaerminnensis]
ECTKTLYVEAEWIKCTFNVDVSTSTIDRALRTNYATIFREMGHKDDKNVIFLGEVDKGRNNRDESGYLSLTASRCRNITVVVAMNKYGMIYHKIHDNAVNNEDFKLSIKRFVKIIFVIENARIHHYRGLNDDEEIASYRIKYLPPYSPVLNLIENVFSFKSSKRIRSHSVQEILDNEYAEIRVDTRIKTDVKIRNNRPDIFILDKKKNKITLIEVGITSQDSLQIVETKKLRKYDLLANELGLIYKCSVEIIPYVMTWDGIVTKYHKSHLKRLEIPMNVEAYIQSIVLKKTVEIISFDRQRGLDWERASMGVIMRAEMHEEPTPPLKEDKREEDGAKNFKPKNNTPLISQGGTTLEEPTNNINKESDLEEETKVVKVVEENM